MEITLIIVAGIVATTLIAAVGDHLTKTRLARQAQNPEAEAALRQRVERLEQLIQDQATKIGQLETDLTFTTKLLEKRE